MLWRQSVRCDRSAPKPARCDAVDNFGRTPAHWAATKNQPRVLELLCTVGADLMIRDEDGQSCLDWALLSGSSDCVQVLLSNGVRLATVRAEFQDPYYIKPATRGLESGVRQCRSVVVALLGIKRICWVMSKLDRFVVQLIMCEIWATRSDKAWQP